jgi:hypothetical protein
MPRRTGRCIGGVGTRNGSDGRIGRDQRGTASGRLPVDEHLAGRDEVDGVLARAGEAASDQLSVEPRAHDD